MRRIEIVAAQCVLVFASVICPAQNWPETGCAKAPKSFEKQIGNVFRAYKTGDENALRVALDEFSIPPDWFAAHFGAEKGAQLRKDYAEQFAYFELQELRRFHWIDKADESRIDSQVCAGHPLKPPAKPAPASLVAIPDAQMIMTLYTKEHGTFSMFGRADRQAHAASSGNLYAEIEGKSRFFGIGGYPFWDPARIRLADMCGKEGEQNGGQLVKRVEPEYPEAARLGGRQGTVLMRLTVGEGGSVTDAEIMDGDSVLGTAAKTAAMQWRYKPWTNCGHPVEMRTVEAVKFPPTPPVSPSQ